ncbi:MAG: hypothetical protein KAX65_14870 [Caldilineaceae bacterium]|nr:hypothetical protein [Caldilineaceae bacterium]
MRQLWQEIDRVKWKVYTGLDDGYLATIDKVNVQRINDAGLRFEELRLLFVASEIEHVETIVKRCGTAGKAARFAAPVEIFDAFFDRLLSFKEARGILNTATAFLVIIDMLGEWLDAHEAEAALNATRVNSEPQI